MEQILMKKSNSSKENNSRGGGHFSHAYLIVHQYFGLQE
jgi:hypothetical protein